MPAEHVCTHGTCCTVIAHDMYVNTSRTCLHSRYHCIVIGISFSGIDTLANQLVYNGLRFNTHRTYRAAQRYYVSFCSAHQLPPLPATEQLLLRFVTYAHTKGLSAATIQVYLAGVASLHTLNGLPSPPTGAYRLKLALKALSSLSTTTKRAPITHDLLTYFISVLHSTSQHWLWQSMLTLGYFGALRGSEYTATYQSGTIFAPLVHQVSIVQLQSSYGIVYTLPRSKTTAKPIHVRIGCSGSDVCAVCSILHYFQYRWAIGTLHPESYLFVHPDGRPVTKHQLNVKIKQLSAMLGLPVSHYSTHSLRSGAATTASSSGFTPAEIKLLGHWTSEAYQHYIHTSHQHQFNFASRLCQSTSN